jgi:hypothetical protein
MQGGASGGIVRHLAPNQTEPRRGRPPVERRPQSWRLGLTQEGGTEGIDPAEEATFELRGSIKRLDCNYYVKREAHAHLEVELVSESTNTPVFSDAYRSDQTEGGTGAGIFGSIETLRQLAERTLRAAIDQVFDDASFSSALANPVVGESEKLEERQRR